MISDIFGTMAKDESLLQRIAALHVLYHKNRSQILWFGQLVGHSPEIMVILSENMIRDEHEMVRLYALLYMP